MSEKLLVLFWDQLSINELAKYHDYKILMIESYHECRIDKHHKKKLVFLISAMRHFYAEVKNKYNIDYIKSNKSIIDVTIDYIIANKISELHMIRPGKYTHVRNFTELASNIDISFTLHENTEFITKIEDFTELFKEKVIMESFYRKVRKKTQLLIENDKPIAGKWNFDHQNRNSLPNNIEIPDNFAIELDQITLDAIDLVHKHFPDHFGDIDPFWLAVTREGALQHFNHFVLNSLPYFGKYQDAMQDGDDFLLFHSGISQYLNVGLLNPLEVCKQVESEYYKSNISIETAEGFIRQIIGWREYIRQIYWHKMPRYNTLNQLNYQNPLPEFYWNHDTEMNCLRSVVYQTKKFAYSHHIQRLMITGNFATLTEVHPDEICNWYLIAYADAHEWVELPNTRGMATYADGGIVGTKPYICSGNYINKMSNFCSKCKYIINNAEQSNACPFNYLYWNFLYKHRNVLGSNRRLSLAYSVLDKMPKEKLEKILSNSKSFLSMHNDASLD